MFEQELYEYIKENFKDANNNKYQVYYGEAPENTKVPYMIQYRLDFGDEVITQCNNNWSLFVQFNVYCINHSQAAYISTKLIEFLKELKTTNNYTILQSIKGSSPLGDDANTGIACATVTREFIYEAKGD